MIFPQVRILFRSLSSGNDLISMADLRSDHLMLMLSLGLRYLLHLGQKHIAKLGREMVPFKGLHAIDKLVSQSLRE
jgi:hypothetical protein